ncbi:TPA: hypothetical protein N0F65_004789 [Lagenidium giganteum]|uniref:Glucose-6-phosphate isomerase n=1 Tax=Lagenidium giganteum TaxID=4803 RepID=A0AAV2Z805_9STRA|nr:TPA: hypothetical protein N0F65_004789 [Lagenidium giganteum]
MRVAAAPSPLTLVSVNLRVITELALSDTPEREAPTRSPDRTSSSTMISDSTAWKRLQEHAQSIKTTHLRTLLEDAKRNEALRTEQHGILLDFSRQNATTETLDLLFDLAEAADLRKKIAAIAAGEHVNVTEDRPVMHMALRCPADKKMVVDGKDVVPDVHAVLNAIKAFSNGLRSGAKQGSTGKQIKNVISIGIGGSYLGPEFVYEALRFEPVAKAASAGRTLRFLANVDPVDVARATDGLNAEETLVIVVSKTFTTAETMLNARTLRKWLVDSLTSKGVSEADAVSKHMIAVSAAVPKVQEFGIDAANIFGFWDWVGGRYSVTSAVGIVPLALHFGFDIAEKFLAGAHDLDTHFLEAPPRTNLPILMGLLGVWNSSFLGHGSRALLPYSQALLRFSAHIQQVDMESNGKRVTVEGVELPFAAGEVNFGEPGTNGQHSFYQLIHQGRVVPCDFLGFCESQAPVELAGEAVSNHDELMSNFFAQPDALARGKSLQDLEAEGVPEHLRNHKLFPGNRPSISLLFPKLDAFTCGQLLALYEHRTVVQGAIWGLNSFDQWGVELGKVLAKQVRNQLEASRKKNAPIAGFNSSTSHMLAKYLQHKSA